MGTTSEREFNFLIDTVFMLDLTCIIQDWRKQRGEEYDGYTVGIHIYHMHYDSKYDIVLTFFDKDGATYANLFRTTYTWRIYESLVKILRGFSEHVNTKYYVSTWSLNTHDIVTEYKQNYRLGYLVSTNNDNIKIVHAMSY